MSKNKRISLIMLIVTIVLAVAIVISLVLLILQRKGLESITINPTFADTELDVNMDYIISVNADPSKVKTKGFSYESDSSSVTFEYKDNGTAILHTSGEGAVTVYVKKGKVESNKLSFQIVDKAAQAAAEAAAAQAAAEAEAQAQAEAEAQAAAEAEAAAASVRYIKCTKDNVNIRSNASTDGDILGKAKLGETFEMLNDDGSWTEFRYGEGSGFMRNDMIEVLPEGSTPDSIAADTSSSESAPAAEPEKKEEAKKEEKPAEEKKEEKTDAQKAEEQAQADAKKAEEEAKKAAEDAQKAAEEAAAAAAALAAAAPPVASGALPASGAWSYQGETFSAAEVAHFHALWDYTGDAAEMVTHHSAGELKTVSRVDGIIQ